LAPSLPCVVSDQFRPLRSRVPRAPSLLPASLRKISYPLGARTAPKDRFSTRFLLVLSCWAGYITLFNDPFRPATRRLLQMLFLVVSPPTPLPPPHTTHNPLIPCDSLIVTPLNTPPSLGTTPTANTSPFPIYFWVPQIVFEMSFQKSAPRPFPFFLSGLPHLLWPLLLVPFHWLSNSLVDRGATNTSCPPLLSRFVSPRIEQVFPGILRLCDTKNYHGLSQPVSFLTSPHVLLFHKLPFFSK